MCMCPYCEQSEPNQKWWGGSQARNGVPIHRNQHMRAVSQFHGDQALVGYISANRIRIFNSKSPPNAHARILVAIFGQPT